MGNQSSGSVSRVVIQNDNDLWKIEKIDSDPPVCLFTSVKPHNEKCEAGVKILRVLRHPNILKFLSSGDLSLHTVSFYSELVYPLESSLPSQTLEGVVRGWRDVGCGLNFVHTKVGLSHNNLHVGCIFVGGNDSKWKIGGFELASKQKQCTQKFFSSVSSIRHRDAIPPEDDEEETTGISNNDIPPIHSRDVWAFGNMMLQTIEDMDNEEDVPDEIIYYINNEMLNQTPELRPSMSEIMTQSWMNNTTSTIIDFLTNITLKPQTDKDTFFRSLAIKLHSLPSLILAEHIVPLLLSPLIMAEPEASKHLWQHLLCPVSDKHPRNNEFKSTGINPLLDESQFRSHVLPPLLNLLESREYHIRLILLHCLQFFCYLCTKEDLIDVVLPEVLVGLKDSRDDIVAGTLHALAELIPFIGSVVVMGTARKNVFADTRPKIQSISSHVYSLSDNTEYSCSSLPLPPLLTDERMKKETISEGNYTPSLKNKETGTESDSSLAPNKRPLVMKYSPSASIDDSNEHRTIGEEETNNVAVVDEEAYNSINVNDDEGWKGFKSYDDQTVADDINDFNTDWGKWDNEDDDEDEEMIEEDLSNYKKDGSINDSDYIITANSSEMATQSKSSSTFKLVLGGSKNKEEKSVPVNGDGQQQETGSDLRKKLKGQLSEEDLKRLEEKAQWTQEVDLFADMAPKISQSVWHSIDQKQQTSSSSDRLLSEDNRSVVSSSQEPMRSVSCNYNPPESEVVDAWDDDEWNNNDV